MFLFDKVYPFYSRNYPSHIGRRLLLSNASREKRRMNDESHRARIPGWSCDEKFRAELAVGNKTKMDYGEVVTELNSYKLAGDGSVLDRG